MEENAQKNENERYTIPGYDVTENRDGNPYWKNKTLAGKIRDTAKSLADVPYNRWETVSRNYEKCLKNRELLAFALATRACLTDIGGVSGKPWAETELIEQVKKDAKARDSNPVLQRDRVNRLIDLGRMQEKRQDARKPDTAANIGAAAAPGNTDKIRILMESGMRESCYAKIQRLAAGMLASAPQFEGYRVCRAAFDRVSAARDKPSPQPVKKRGRSI